ncbi:hypothetical protein, partial [Chromobacterium phragmitis]|uniref:hypothetical protein n=1 Tax=Chromobacterium phragmitis TaxID=2202141 RepID=UPI0032651261
MNPLTTRSEFDSLNLRAHWMPFSANRNFQRDPRLIVAGAAAPQAGQAIEDAAALVIDQIIA